MLTWRNSYLFVALLALCVYCSIIFVAPPDSTSLSSTTTSSSLEMSLLVKQRAKAAIIGGFVADAASMGLHWIYDKNKLSEIRQDPTPEFFNPPSCPFYKYDSGALSPYGAEVYPLLQYVAEAGEFDPKEFTLASYRASKEYTGYKNHIIKSLIANVEEGKTYPDVAMKSDDPQGVIKVPVLVAKYPTDTAVLIEKTIEAAKVHQFGDVGIGGAIAAALLLQKIVHGAAIPDAIADVSVDERVPGAVRELIQQVLDAVATKKFPDAFAAMTSFGISCPLPGSFQGGLYVLLTAKSYTEAVRTNIHAGGDNCSRAIFIGSCFAAATASAEGDAIPAEWKEKTTLFPSIKEFADKL